VETNLLGPTRVAAAMAAVRPDQPPAHLVAVSTAYVAGTRRGDAPEALLPDTPFATAVGWQDEVAYARRARADVDAESRDPDADIFTVRDFLRAERSGVGRASKSLSDSRSRGGVPFTALPYPAPPCFLGWRAQNDGSIHAD
jgi:hypothetical protein